MLIATAAILASSGVAMAAPDPHGAPAFDLIHAPSSVETIAYTRRKTPTPSAGYMKSAGYSGGGLVGVLVSVATTAAMDHVSGSRTLSEHQLRDPSPDISQALAGILADRREAVVASEAVFIKGGKPAAIAKAAPGARYVVDVQTLYWEVAGMSTKKSQYPSSYEASLRVIDGQSGTVAVSSNCHWASPLIKVNAEGLAGDKTEILRNHFAAATEACLEQFKITMRSLHLTGAEREPRAYIPPQHIAVLPPPVAMSTEPYPQPPRIEPAVARPTAVAAVALPPAPPAPIQAKTSPPPPTIVRVEQPLPPPELPTQPRPTQIVYAQAQQWGPRLAGELMPPYVEYPYARPYEAPPSKTRAPAYAVAGRDADGYLVWPGKRP